MKDFIVTNLKEAISAFDELANRSAHYGHNLWFRAESSRYTKTHLVPNLFREYFCGPTTTLTFKEKEDSIMTSFESEAYPYLRDNGLLDSHIGKHFILQHYGGETRLLDWTENPLISLFFAVENIVCQDDAIIWSLDPYKLNGCTYSFATGSDKRHLVLYPSLDKSTIIENYLSQDRLAEDNNGTRYPIALKPFYVDDRMRNQSSRFTLFGHDKKGLTNHPSRDTFLGQVRVPHTNFRIIKRELYKLGISYDTIYPGLEGIAKKTNYAFNEYFI